MRAFSQNSVITYKCTKQLATLFAVFERLTSNGYVALGIHVGAYKNGTINYGKRITVTLFDWLESEGYINS